MPHLSVIISPPKIDGYSVGAAPAPAPEPKPSTILDLLKQIGVPVEQLLKDLRELALKYPDLEQFIAQAVPLISTALGYEHLLELKTIIAKDLWKLSQTGSGPVERNPVDLS